MAERIDKTVQKYDYLRTEASAESDKDRGQSGEEEDRDLGYSDQFRKLQDKTDWEIFLDKSHLWKKNIQVNTDDIEAVFFRKINLKTDPSLLRVDIKMADGEIISPAFLPIARIIALKLKDMKSGEIIPDEHILNDNFLRITIPSDPQMFLNEEKNTPKKGIPKDENAETTVINRQVSWFDRFLEASNIKDLTSQKVKIEFTLIYGVIILVLALLSFAAVFLL